MNVCVTGGIVGSRTGNPPRRLGRCRGAGRVALRSNGHCGQVREARVDA